MKDLDDKLEKAKKADERRRREKDKEKAEERYEDLPSAMYHKIYE